MSLIVSNLSCQRGAKTVLSDLSIRLGAGHAMLLRGPNGVGKSTLLRGLAGLVPVTGSVSLHDLPITDRDAYEENILYAGHLDAIKPQLSVAENLAFWAAIYGGDPYGALDRMGIGHIADRPAGICSAGQKRRLGLARLLLAPRALWLLDEPTVSLDADGALALAGLIKSHLAAGGMALIATHIDLALEAEVLTLAPAVVQADDPFLTGSFQ